MRLQSHGFNPSRDGSAVSTPGDKRIVSQRDLFAIPAGMHAPFRRICFNPSWAGYAVSTTMIKMLEQQIAGFNPSRDGSAVSTRTLLLQSRVQARINPSRDGYAVSTPITLLAGLACVGFQSQPGRMRRFDYVDHYQWCRDPLKFQSQPGWMRHFDKLTNVSFGEMDVLVFQSQPGWISRFDSKNRSVALCKPCVSIPAGIDQSFRRLLSE